MLLRDDDHVLFYGDSITDAGWRDPADSNDGLGHGYVAAVRSMLADRPGGPTVRLTNRGVSGNRVYDLADRLDADVLALAPSVVSIMIGINDTWRRYDSNVASPVGEFEACLRGILERIRDELSARVVICEPFLLPIPDDRAAWREDLDPRIAAIRRLARQFADVFVPLDGVFAAAACRKPMDHWLGDGVHPTPAGHQLIAREWLRAVTEEA